MRMFELIVNDDVFTFQLGPGVVMDTGQVAQALRDIAAEMEAGHIVMDPG